MAQLKKIENQNGFIAQLLETTKPTGLNGNQIKFQRKLDKTPANIPPKQKAEA